MTQGQVDGSSRAGCTARACVHKHDESMGVTGVQQVSIMSHRSEVSKQDESALESMQKETNRGIHINHNNILLTPLLRALVKYRWAESGKVCKSAPSTQTGELKSM